MSSDNQQFELKIKDALKSWGLDNEDSLKEEQYEIFYRAFTHKTYANEHKRAESYQYLEFLGDTVLQFVVSDIIFRKFPKFNEGDATALRSSIVDKKNLGYWSEKMGLPSLLRASKNAFINGKNIKTDSDIFESMIAAVYLVFGFQKTYQFISNLLKKEIENFSKKSLKDPKSKFQELIQISGANKIEYETHAIENSLFKSSVFVNEMKYGSGTGNSKKEAEKNAALDALTKI
ncbi:ribonuclease III [Mycoplasma phocoeninasale]|uniref:Ribonuclease 3 n=1 Tax=Mycoplasma phocoeninasale TaxID=2726117 RepID=A0A858TZY3_9MOLU|nr:ribonuclease III [Mycoplasma phocoeninasale]MBN0970513.1 ribonuclease III [Mycoplasma phocoeninasale]QJG66364.1 ribonuclease III [Mycoplasma phocoeninasale]